MSTDVVVSADGPARDPDDALALLMLMKLGANVVGISTVPGNDDIETVNRSALRLVQNPVLYRTRGMHCDAPFIHTLEKIFEKDRTAVVALGPLTSVAGFIRCRPDLARNITRIIFVGGRRPGEELYLSDNLLSFTPLRDLNVEVDRGSLLAVLNAGIPIDLVPFRAGNAVRLSPAYFYSLPTDVALAMLNWSGALWFVGGGGTMPAYDPVAASLALWPHTFRCQSVSLALEGNELIARNTTSAAHRWCEPKDPHQIRHLVTRALNRPR